MARSIPLHRFQSSTYGRCMSAYGPCTSSCYSTIQHNITCIQDDDGVVLTTSSLMGKLEIDTTRNRPVIRYRNIKRHGRSRRNGEFTVSELSFSITDANREGHNIVSSGGLLNPQNYIYGMRSGMRKKQLLWLYGGGGGIRTPDKRNHYPLLYRTELSPSKTVLV